ncbi:uncharacterized protein EI97DRAFT_119098 [Westerdykella ornata]|uniref:Uncharacterized protein n=1 Tax=Westerdykella ornata TaxID=318751 RepID=A0A6A6JUR5_WESOR|nr:uncharacterized protein EI97DRAFT_119098 [Westerdykella ornata]KAF2280322.1 hypothetical protein EI97DRAFT_119098 [Westerdykella ornata]
MSRMTFHGNQFAPPKIFWKILAKRGISLGTAKIDPQQIAVRARRVLCVVTTVRSSELRVQAPHNTVLCTMRGLVIVSAAPRGASGYYRAVQSVMLGLLLVARKGIRACNRQRDSCNQRSPWSVGLLTASHTCPLQTGQRTSQVCCKHDRQKSIPPISMCPTGSVMAGAPAQVGEFGYRTPTVRLQFYETRRRKLEAKRPG